MATPQVLCRGRVTQALDPGNFWIVIGAESNFQEFAEYQSKVNSYYNELGRKNNVSLESLSQGDPVMVADTGGVKLTVPCDGDDCDTNFHWNRARVSRVLQDGDDRVDIFYIDLGKTEIVSILHVKGVHQELFEYFPPQAVRMGLAGIKPLTRSWTSRAHTFFQKKVLSGDLVVSLAEYDESQVNNKVWIYVREDDGDWHSITHDMLAEDLGLPCGDLVHYSLSNDIVIAALNRLEENQRQSSDTAQATGDRSSPFENEIIDDDDDVTEGDPLKGPSEDSNDNNLAQACCGPNKDQPSSKALSQLYLPSPAEFMMQPSAGSTPETSTPVGVSGFDLTSLMQTRSISISKMQEEMESETQLRRKATLEQDLRKCEDDESHESHEYEWGRTDLQLGQAHAFPDIHEDISREIYKSCPRQSSLEELAELFPSRKKLYTEQSSTASATAAQYEDRSTRSREKIKPLTEEEDYEIQKQVQEILSDNSEPDMVCGLIRSIVQPDEDAPADQLKAVFTSILETMMRDSTIDPSVALGTLETYTTAKAFQDAIQSVLKSLKDKLVKLSQNVRSPGYHRPYAQVLAMVFIQAESWPTSACSKVQEFAMASLERWTIYNRQRSQESDNAINVEHMFLECVMTFLEVAQDMVASLFPERYHNLLDEMRQKLLHDSTNRSVRSHLLDMLLKLHNSKTAWSSVARVRRTEVATQTDRKEGSLFERETPDPDNRAEIQGRSWQRSGESITTAGYYRPPRGTLYPRGDPFTPYVFPDAVADSPEKTEDPDTVSVSEMYSKLMIGTSDKGPSLNEGLQRISSASSMSHTGLDERDAASHQTFLHSPAKRNASQTVEKEVRKRGFPKSLAKLPPRLQQKFLQERGLAGEVGGGDMQSNTVPNMLNVNAPEFIPISPGSEVTTASGISDISKEGDSLNDSSLYQISNNSPHQELSNNLTDGGRFTEPKVNREEEAIQTITDYIQDYPQDESSISIKSGGIDTSDVEIEEEKAPTEVESSRYRYTSAFLKTLDPYRFKPNLRMANIKHPEELKHLFEKPQTGNTSDPHDSAELEKAASIATTPLVKYTGQGGTPLQLSKGPKSNFAKWQALSELLPQSSVRPSQYSDFSTSVDPEPSGLKRDGVWKRKSEGGEEAFSQTHAKTSSLKDIANVLTLVDESEQDLDLLNSVSETGDHKVADTDKTDLNRNQSHTADETEINGEVPTSNTSWSETFFKSVSPVAGSVHANVNNSGDSCTPPPVGGSKKKGKKKKTKFRPLDEVLLAEESNSTVLEGSKNTYKVDEFAFGVDEDDNFDEFSEEAIKMYEELDQMEQQKQNEELEPRVIHPSRLGAHAGNTSTRNSLFADLRRQPTTSSGGLWVPGKRKCTSCGSEDHIVYDCPDKKSFVYLEDQSYLLL